MIGAILLACAVPAAIMLAVWAWHEVTRESGWIDVAWTAAVGIGGVAGALWSEGGEPGARQVLYAAMVAAWALRLGGHLFARTLRHPDDPRYAALRAQWGARSPLMMAGLLVIQAAVAALLGLSVAIVARAPVEGIAPVDLAAAALFAIASIGEAAADAQMRRFQRDPANRGGICDTGLWAWSRHPNYFFEWLGWVAMALGLLAAPGWLPGWIALTAPLLMLHLLLNVSGVPPLEAHMRATRGAAFDRYAARVSRFLPLPPRKPVEVA
jgi:steroid 5-alpha reductase family enzyme